MQDTSAARAEARRLAIRERAETARAEADLALRTGTDLSSWTPLSPSETQLFLDLLSAARNNRAPDGSMTGVSADGRWRLRLLPTHPRRPAILRTPTGRLILADARVEITS